MKYHHSVCMCIGGWAVGGCNVGGAEYGCVGEGFYYPFNTCLF